MLIHLLLSNRLFARLLNLMFVLSLFHVSITTNSTERKDSSPQVKAKLTSSDDLARNLAATDQTDSSAENSSHWYWGTASKDEYSSKDGILREYLCSAISGKLDALNYFAPLLPIGVEAKLVDDKFQLKFNGNSMNYDDMPNAMSYIIKEFKPFLLGSISISNLPLDKINGAKICEIMNGNSKPSKFSMSSCFFDENEDKFYKGLPSLSLTELELNKSGRINEILEKTDSSLQVLQLTKNSINLNFSQLTELLRKFTNLKKLTLLKNRIGIAGFEVFFDFIFSLKGLTELHLVNNGVVDRFLKLLSERKITSSLKTLTLREHTKISIYPNLDCLLKSQLETLSLTIDSTPEFYDNYSYYLKNQKTLKKIICKHSNSSYSSKNNILKLASDKNVIFDLNDYFYYSFTNLTTQQQLSNITQLCIERKQIEEDLISLSSSVASLPELQELTWSNYKIDPSLITDKSLNLEMLRIDEKCSEHLRSKGFFNEKRVFPSLVDFKCHYPEKPSYNYEDYCENGNFHEFFLANPSIKKLETNYCFLAVYVNDVLKSSQQKASIKSIEDIHISCDYDSDFSALFRSLQFFPNVKKLDLFLNDHGDSVPISCEPLNPLHLTKIEELSIHDSGRDEEFIEAIKELLSNSPNIKVLSLECLQSCIFYAIVDSFKHLPHLTKLKISCDFVLREDDYDRFVGNKNAKKDKKWKNNYLTHIFIQRINSLNYLSHVEIELRPRERSIYKELDAVVLPFSKKKIVLTTHK